MQGHDHSPFLLNEAARWNDQGLKSLEQGNLLQARKQLRAAHLLSPQDGRVLVNLGFSFHARNQLQAAERCCRLALNSGDSGTVRSATKNLAFLRLEQKDLFDGWFWYQKQLQDQNLIRHQWRGLDDSDSHLLLVWNDMGQGDAIQFCRYLPQLIATGYRIRLAVQPELIPLMRHWLPVVAPEHLEVVNSDADAWNGIERFITVLNLCRLLDPTLNQAANCNHPYLSLQKDRLDNPLPPLPPGRRIGICWASNPGDPSLYQRKSIPLASLLDGLTRLEHDQLISLQRGEHTSRHQHRPAFAAELPDSADWCTTAQWILGCDVVISVDTAVAHLAGALGVPVIVLLPWVKDWRWHYGRQGQRWYPRCTTIQKTALNDWSSVFKELNAFLKRENAIR